MSSLPAYDLPPKPRLADFTKDAAGVWRAPHVKPFNYSDGDATEERMYKIVTDARDTDVYSRELIAQISDWPSEYHFSPRRANLIRLLDRLDASHRVLELGCGCGAITKALAETGCTVDAIEGSPRRARVAAARVRKHANATIFNSNFQDVAMEPAYDLVTLIGVLEYSPVYLDADDPFVACLDIALSALKPGGTLLVAIENKLGLKYFAGIPEDHFNRPYYGIEGRYGKKQTTTYGREVLERKLRTAGFGEVSFYFPFPDYKLPEVVIAEHALANDDFRPADLLQGMEHRDYSGRFSPHFNLDMALQSLQEEGLLGAMANSFLVLATREGQSPLTTRELLAQKYTDTRIPGFNSITSFVGDAQGIDVHKKPMAATASQSALVEHIHTQEGYCTGQNLHSLLRRAAINGHTEDVGRLVKLWIETLHEAADDKGLLPGDWVDAIASNLILRADGGCTYIDREWRMPKPIHPAIPLYRGLIMLSEDAAVKAVLPEGDNVGRVRWLCRAGGEEYDAETYRAALLVSSMLWQEIYAGGNEWCADRYRHRKSPVAALQAPPPKPLDYAEIVALQRSSEDRIATLTRDMPAPRARIECIVLAGDGDEAMLSRTLDSIAGVAQPPYAVSVLGDMPIPARFAHVNRIEPSAGTTSTQINHHLERTEADWVQLVSAGDAVSPLLFALLDEQIAAHPELAAIYMDEDSTHEGKPAAPIFKPDFNLDLLRSYPYVGRALAFHRTRCTDLGGMVENPAGLGGQDLMFRLVERHGLQAIGHIAEAAVHAGLGYVPWLASPMVTERSAAVVSAHLERLGVTHEMEPGGVPGVNRVRYLHQHQPPVSIIIPTRDQLPMLNGLIDSLLAKTRYKNYELLIVDNDSREPAACAYLDGIERMANPQLRVLRYPHPFNYPAINNFAAKQARGEYLILLNNDTAVLHDDWIEALLNHAQRPEVGIVGAKLHYPDGRIQHAGMVLGLRGAADFPFGGDAADAPGYMHRLLVDQNYSAVTASCMMIRKSVYDEVGGMDEQDLKVSYNDVDLCLKVHQAGYLTVWTPHARLMHEGGASQARVDKTTQADKLKRFEGEQEAMYRKWLPLLARDPAYNRNLSLDGTGFVLDQSRHLAWQPFGKPLLPRMFCVAADVQGCGHYRIRQPFAAMQREGLAEGMVAVTHLMPVAMERFEPSAIVLQRQITDSQFRTMQRYREFSQAFKVYELDDYLPNIPLKSIHRGDMPKDIMKALRRAVALTDRLVVSTAPLAEQFADLHGDIRVVPNRLPVDWWGGLSGERRKGAKPRVGWAGGGGHRGDLELISDVVRDLAGEVEWVFLGMCPEKLRPYVHEFHEGVPIEQYPARLAALNLDLALAPLEDNVFNACKSNLRLLEYGACGIPVICSDIACYRGDLPATRVRNRYKEWVDAIRMHLADLDATARLGDELQTVVRGDWMLAGDNLVAWRDAWLPG